MNIPSTMLAHKILLMEIMGNDIFYKDQYIVKIGS